MWVRCDGTTYPCSTCQVAAKLSGSGCSSTDSVACSAPHVNPHVRYVIQAGTSTESNESHVRAETCHCFPVAFAGQIWLQLISGARSWLGSLGEAESDLGVSDVREYLIGVLILDESYSLGVYITTQLESTHCRLL